jgi:acyl-coenzyme A synthetase/AMP-(fatty) acid ligase
MDDQVKVNGFSIELAEIENVYSEHEAVDQAVAVVRDGKLMIYLKASAGVTLTKYVLGKVRESAQRSLTYYMLPRYINNII